MYPQYHSQTNLKMKQLLSILVILCAYSYGFGQNNISKSKGSITGKIIDQQGQPVEYVNVILFSNKDSAMVSGTITNTKGEYYLSNVPYGAFYLEYQYFGFEPYRTESITINSGNKNVVIETVTIQSILLGLEEVQVLGSAKHTQHKLDKKVITVGSDIDATSGNALDILEKTASVQVDMEGSLSLRGNSNITILIDGKPQTIRGNTILSSIPAANIETIEIITNPSAKYQSEGIGGIINIIMKKNKKDSFNGMLNVKLGNDDKYAGDANIFYNKGKYSFYGQVMYSDITSYHTSIRDRIIYSDTDEDLYYTDAYKNRKYLNLDKFIEIGNGFDMERIKTFLNVKYGQFQWNRYKMGLQEFWTESHSADSSFWNDVTRELKWSYMETDLTTKINSTNKKHALELDLFTSFEEGTDSYQTFSYPINSSLERIGEMDDNRSYQDGTYRYYQATADYGYKPDSTSKIEAGIFYNYVNRSHIYNCGNYNYEENVWDYDDELKNDINIDHFVLAGYINYNRQIGNLEIQGGLRMETEDREIVTALDSTPYTFQATDFFPSLYASYELSKRSTLFLSAGRRKQMPQPWFLVPYSYELDRYVIRQGNPDLKPEYVIKYEAGTKIKLKKYTSSVVLFSAHVKDEIWLATDFSDDNVMGYQKMFNVDKHLTWGIESENRITITKPITVTVFATLFSNYYKGDLFGEILENNNWVWQVKTNTNLSLTKTTQLQFSTVNYSAYALLMGQYKPMFMANASIKQNFYKGKLTINLKMKDIFNTRKNSGRQTFRDGYYAYYSNWGKRYLILGISYNFNKYTYKQKHTEVKRGAL